MAKSPLYHLRYFIKGEGDNMPEFTNINTVYSPNKKLTQIEMLRAIKFAIASEYEAIQLYQQIMESTDNKDVKIVLGDVAREEKHHVGELRKLLEILSPEDEKEYRHGDEETIENLSK